MAPCATSGVLVLECASQLPLALLTCGVQPEMNIQKSVRKRPMLSLGLRTGLPQVPFPCTTRAFVSCQLCPAWPSSEEPHCSPVSTLTAPGLLSSSPPPPPHVCKGVWGRPICDRSEVSAGLGQGASQSGTGGAGHTVGLLSNWKPGAQQNPVNRLSGTEPAMTARPRQAGRSGAVTA